MDRAYLITCEKPGVGENSAVKLAQDMFCPSGCGICDICRRIANRNFPEIMWIGARGANVRIEDVRESIAFANISGKRAVIVADAESLSEAAQNCLLKTIETLPEGTSYILVAKTVRSILPTVLSRVSRIKIEPDIKGGGLYERLSGGYKEEAKRLKESEQFNSIRGETIAVFDALNDAKGYSALTIADRFLKLKDDIPVAVEILLSLFNDAYIEHITGDEELFTNIDVSSKIVRCAQLFTRSALGNIIETVLKFQEGLNFPLNLRLQTEAMFFKILEEKFKWQE